jgi:predicted esterase
MSARDLLREFPHRFVPAEDPAAGVALLLLHGTGGNEDDLIPLGRLLDPGAALLSPRGRVLENGLPRFFRRLAEGVFDVEDLILRTHELADFVERARDAYRLGATPLVAAGFSNGANIAASLLLLRPGLLRGAALFHAMVPLEPETPARLAGTDVFVSAGRTDPLITPEQSEGLANLLSAAGARVELHWEDAGHTLTRSEVDAARAWLARRVQAVR